MSLSQISLVLILALTLTACMGREITPAPLDTTAGAPQAEQKVGETTKTGTISQAGGKFFLTEAGSTPKEIDSLAVDLTAYVGQTVTVTGQYSGDTLFIGKVQ